MSKVLYSKNRGRVFMERKIYHRATGAVEPFENFESKKEQKFVDGKFTTSYQGWEKVVVYTIDELREVGRPTQSTWKALLEVAPGEYKTIYSMFNYYSSEERRKDSQNPSFGKICILSDGTFFDLEKGEPAFKDDIREFESFDFFDKGFYSAFSHDWSAFDVIGAFDESYYSLRKQGVEIARSSKPFFQVFDKDKNLVGFRTNGYEISLQQAQEKFERKQEKQELVETLKELKAKGIKAEDVASAMQDVFGIESVK